MPTFNQLASDDFNRANSGDLGANWDAGYTNYLAFSIIGNAAWPTSQGTAGWETYNNITWPNDQYAEGVLGSWIDENQAAIVLRGANSPTQTAYLVVNNRFTSGTVNTDEIYKVIADVYTQLSTATNTWAQGASMRGAVIGTDIYLYENTVQVLTASDSAISSGKGGIYGLYFTGGGGGQFSFDSWAGGEAVGDAAASLPHHLLLLGVGR